jgi:hypothetical protein
MTPSRSAISLKAEGLDGIEVVGSGKSVIPWVRIQCETLTICPSASEEGCVGSRPVMNFSVSAWHFVRAVSNVGEFGFIPGGSANSPLALGSGKFGTPWVRIQRVYVSAPMTFDDSPVAATVVVVALDPLLATSGDGPLPQADSPKPTEATAMRARAPRVRSRLFLIERRSTKMMVTPK